jgi:hypothetical protein
VGNYNTRCKRNELSEDCSSPLPVAVEVALAAPSVAVDAREALETLVDWEMALETLVDWEMALEALPANVELEAPF